jgi:hypothetical protein
MTRVTLGKSRVRESCTPGSVRAKAEWLSYSTVTVRLTDHSTSRRMPTGNDRAVSMDDVVQEAIKMAIEALPEGEWALLEPSERTRRIYDEIRRIDAQHAADSVKSESGH